MSYETVILNVDAGVATLTLNRPDRMNALNAQLKRELGLALDRVESDGDIRVLVLTGAGDKAFCAGADIKERAGTDPAPAEFLSNQRQTHALFSRIADMEKPVIVALNGVALGGGFEIALCGDLRIAAEHVKVGLPEVNLGVIPAGGGTQRLPRLIGAGRAKRLIMTATTLGAADAMALGLLDEVIAASALRDRVASLAAEIAAKPPLAVRLAKRVIDQGMETDLRSALEFELYAASILFDSEDRKEGMQAFVEKRKPVFKGR